jgi:hypothetical protein
MNHTPGPWMAIKYKKQNVKELGFLILQNRGFDETNIATVFKAIDVSEEQIEANAKLIAAAPELLEALCANAKILEWVISQKYSMWSAQTQGLHDALAKTNSVIKKATE